MYAHSSDELVKIDQMEKQAVAAIVTRVRNGPPTTHAEGTESNAILRRGRWLAVELRRIQKPILKYYADP